MKEKISIAIADKEIVFKSKIEILQKKFKTLDILFEAKTTKELIHQLKNCEKKPSIILIDLELPLFNGLETIKSLFKEAPNIKIIAITNIILKSFFINMIGLGAISYLRKNASLTTVISTLKEVHDKGYSYDDRMIHIIHESLIQSKRKILTCNANIELLSMRELEILELICNQHTSTEIAKKLCISRRTVEGHRNKMLVKTGTKNVAGLVIYGLQKNLVKLTENF